MDKCKNYWLAVLFAVLLMSCNTVSKLDYNPDLLPAEKLAKVNIPKTVALTKINEKEGKYAPTFGNYNIKIAEGTHTLWLNYHSVSATTTTTTTITSQPAPHEYTVLREQNTTLFRYYAMVT